MHQRGRGRGKARWASQKPLGRLTGWPARGRGEVEVDRGEEPELTPAVLAGPKTKWADKASRAKSEKPIGRRIFGLKNGFLNLPRLWKFAEGDLGGI
jgi:hypothetical protein